MRKPNYQYRGRRPNHLQESQEQNIPGSEPREYSSANPASTMHQAVLHLKRGKFHGRTSAAYVGLS